MMPSCKLAALLALIVPLGSGALAAPGATPSDTKPLMVVEGLAKDDMLNIRATASATGMVIGRLANGSALRNLGCDQVNGYQWCNIASVDDERLHGWTPGRYLRAVEGDAEGQPAAAEPATEEAAAGTVELLPSEGVPVPEPRGGKPDVMAPADASASAEEPVTEQNTLVAAAGAAIALPLGAMDGTAIMGDRGVASAGLSARMGGSATGKLAYGTPDSAATVVETDAIASALKMAFASSGTPEPGDFSRSGSANGEAPTAVPQVASQPPAAAQAPPVPARAPETVARVALLSAPIAAAAAGDTAGEVPCARYIGQPMTRCQAVIARTGAEAAEVTITLPDGGRRIIRFQNGKPEGSNSRGEFRFTREGDLSMIRIGTSERFEILDSVAFGE